MTKGVCIGKDGAVSGSQGGGTRPLESVGLVGFGPKETKRSWRRGVFVAGWREGRLRLFGAETGLIRAFDSEPGGTVCV